MDPDKQMIRSQDGDVTNLAIGEPFFLQKHLECLLAPIRDRGGEHYPHYNGSPDLLRALQVRNPGKHVVITNGAKQALLAAIYACNRPDVAHPTPHWPSYPTLAKLSGKGWAADSDHHSSLLCVSSPNNPDGREMVEEPCDVWDAAYAHWVYGWSSWFPVHRISVWSAAKLFGLSGERIGWACTEDAQLAERMADYVEKTTSGVNIHAQARLARILQLNYGCLAAAYEEAREDLLANARVFYDLIGDHCSYIRGTPMGDPGMFAWFHVIQPKNFQQALARAKVALVDGKACGMNEDGWYRMSMGHTREITEEALTRLAKELDNG